MTMKNYEQHPIEVHKKMWKNIKRVAKANGFKRCIHWIRPVLQEAIDKHDNKKEK